MSEHQVYMPKERLFNIAGCLIQTNYHTYPSCLKLLKGFELDGYETHPDYVIYFENPESLKGSDHKKKGLLLLPVTIKPDVFQYFLRELLQDYFHKRADSFFIHCSAVLRGSKAALFLGPNGAGKSTISRFLSSEFVLLSDDAGIIKKKKERFYFYQTPFQEKQRSVKRRNGHIIDSVFFLRKSNKYKVSKITKRSDLSRRFISQIWTDPKRIKRQLFLAVEFLHRHKKWYYLDFPKDKGTVCEGFKKLD